MRAGLIGALAAAALLASASSASAVVYCVPNNSIDGSCQTPHATIQAALTAAQTSTAVADTVLIGPGSFSEPGLIYNDTTPTNVVTVIGVGTAQTVLTMPSTVGTNTGLQVGGPAGSSVQNLAMTVPVNADGGGEIGIRLGHRAEAENLLVNGPAATNTTGILQESEGILDDAVVDLPFASPTNQGISTVSGNGAVITEATIHADIGLTHGGAGTTTVERSTIEATFAGSTQDQGTMILRNTLIDLSGSNNGTGVNVANFNNGASPLAATLDGVTLVNAGAGSTGVRAQADSDTNPPIDGDDMVNDNESSTVTIRNTVIDDFTTPLRVEADRGEVATMTTDYSNYDTTAKVVTSDLSGTGATGTASFTEMNQTNVAPGFVNPGTDYHLLPTSALLDIGDPAAPMGGSTDIDGDPRGLDKDASCTSPDAGRRDIGADEFVAGMLDCIAPDTTVATGPTGTITDSTPTFTFTATEAGTFQCSLNGGGFAACPTPFTTNALADGAHTLAVRAVDASLNQDPTPAMRSFTVDTTAPNTTATGPAKLKLKGKKRKTATATYALGSTETGSTLQCSLDGGAFATCSASHSVALRKGTHTLSVRATDAVGNVDSTPATVLTRVLKKKKKKK